MTDAWTEAVTLLRSALKLLDESSTPLHIGAQLEFVIDRLEASTFRSEPVGARYEEMAS